MAFKGIKNFGGISGKNWTTTSPLSEEQRKAVLQLSNLTRIFVKVDRALANTKDLDVKLQAGGPAPFWNDGHTISFNTDEITEMDVENLIGLHGGNYHELSHILFTPRKNQEPTRTVLSEQRESLKHAYNILEDQRIETLFTARFPSTIPFLTATVTRWIMDPFKPVHETHPLTYGRKYLPADVRQAVRDAYAHPEDIDEIEKIIDEYRLLDVTKDYRRAYKLVEQFEKLLHNAQSPCQDNRLAEMGEGSPDGDQGESIEIAKGQGEGQGQGQAEGEGEGDGEENDGTPGHAPGTSQRKLNDAARAAAKKALQQVQEDHAVIEEMQGKLRNITKPSGFYQSILPDVGAMRHHAPSGEAVTGERKFQDALRILVEECDPGWDRRTPSGRLNVGRVSRGCDLEEAFDRWEDGSDGYDLEVALLVDISGSMSAVKNEVEEFAWLMHSAIEKIGASCTTIGFGAGSYIMYPKGQKPQSVKMVDLEGSTNPAPALEEAERTLWSSLRKNKLLIIVTDGSWAYEGASEETMRRIEALGATSAVAFLSDEVHSYETLEQYFRHGAQIFRPVSDIPQLATWAKSLVKEMIRKRSRRVR